MGLNKGPDTNITGITELLLKHTRLLNYYLNILDYWMKELNTRLQNYIRLNRSPYTTRKLLKIGKNTELVIQ